MSAPLPVARGRKGGDSDLVLDKKARKQIEDKVVEFREAGRVDEADELEVYLEGAIDIQGRTRQLGSKRDQDRVNVGKRIKLALAVVERDLPELYDHLGGKAIFSHGKVKTALTAGAYCTYCPPKSMNCEVRV